MFRYALKRVSRSYRLFIALTLGVLVATSFFASTNVAADILARDSLDSSLEGVIFDFTVNSWDYNWTGDTFDAVEAELDDIEEVTSYSRATIFGYEVNETTEFDIAGVDMSSDYTSDFRLVSGRDTLGPNETYIVAGSVNESLYAIDDVITVPIMIGLSEAPLFTIIEWNFTIAGIVDVPTDIRHSMEPMQDMFAGIFSGAFGVTFDDSYNYMITDWDLSINDILTSSAGLANQTGRAIRNTLLLTIDRTDLIDPYDIQGSSDRITVIQSKIESRLSGYDVYVGNNLIIPLLSYMIVSIMMIAVFMTLSIPIFFMAYFTGTMVSDIGYNLRRREIGLLLTKGYKRGTIRNMFLIEGLLVGAIAGSLAVFIGTGAAWFALGIEGLDFFTALTNNVTSIVLSIILGMTLALLSVYRPANRASKLEIIDALKQYVLVEETSEYKRLLPTIAFVLGTYKIIVWILGINMSQLLPRILGGNIALVMVVGIWTGIDSLLNFVGPIMFLYGTTKLFIRKSERFQEAIVKAGHRFFGAFGTLATRNIKRNPARNAAMVFILSLIVSYGVFAVGSLFSEYDRVERGALFSVGSDVSLQLDNSINMTEMDDMISDIVENENVESATAEYNLNLYTGSTTIEIRGIRPNEWLSSAFWEPGWFVGDVFQMMENLDDNGIILSVTIASELDLIVGDSIRIHDAFGIDTHELEIVGIVGYRSIVADFLEEMGINQEGSFPSFVSESFLNESAILATATSTVLINTAPNVNGTALQETFIELFGDELDSSFSVTSYMNDYWDRPIQSGITKIQWVAIAFSAVLALVVTGLVIILTLREKEIEIALITVRGFSKWQLFKTLMAEMLIMVLFALILGTFVGMVQIFGNVSQLNEGLTNLIRYQIVLGGAAGSTMLLIIGVVLAAATIPIYWASRRPEAKVDSLRA